MGCGGSTGERATRTDKILFAAPETSTYGEWSYKNELVWIPLARYGGWQESASSGSRGDYSFPCRLLKHSSARYLLIYFHRNGDDLGLCCSFVEKLHSTLQVHVLAVEYPGYGLCSDASCTAVQVNKHAAASLAFVQRALRWPLERILVMGDCVGVGPAVDLAAKAKFAGLVLVAPFLSARKLFRDHVGFLATLVSDAFPNDALAPHIRSPTLIFHGTDDKMTPVAHSRQLERLLTCPRRLVIPEQAGHQVKLTDDGHFVGPVREFFQLTGDCREAPLLHVPSWAYKRHRQPHELDDELEDAAAAPDAPAEGCGPERKNSEVCPRPRSTSRESSGQLVAGIPKAVSPVAGASEEHGRQRGRLDSMTRPAGAGLAACCCPTLLVR